MSQLNEKSLYYIMIERNTVDAVACIIICFRSNFKFMPFFTHRQLCDDLAKLILSISDFHKELKGKLEKGNRDTLLLYLSQLITSLSLLIDIFVKESNVNQTLTEARLCAKKRIIWCLDGIQETLTTNKSILDPSGSFIKWMDSALDKIAEIDAEKGKTAIIGICNDAGVLFEEVLSHAMSIAQVALKEDCTIIRGSCQTVLDSLDSLTVEINKPSPNPAMLNLFVDTCTDKLCALERRVNTAVLKLGLRVFSEYDVALEAIHDFCNNVMNKEKMEELDSLVADFDFHVDRIMQIGLFAVSCSTCTSRGIKIRSSLASLESLECELVPAFTAMLLEHSVHNANLAILLKSHWLRQANILRKLIYLIIDPFAFCQVIYEENKQHVESFSKTIKQKHLLDKKHVVPLIDQSQVLLEFLDIAIKEEKRDEDTKNTKQKFNDFKNVLHEVQSASDVLLDNKNKMENSLRVLKRCKILLTTIKRLWHCFREEMRMDWIKRSSQTKHSKDRTHTFEYFFSELVDVEDADLDVDANDFIL
ncbi:hypothetical protein NQ318_000217 [Aromia moschata]|uniref:Serendipity locus protein alpha n=1 Tax=Aromia moschata TaxID=1265417 RepID=A0AAV8YJQ5_9CUCU|nr:hypothetical protein NQ318_000217 [Aromia moschata]